MEFEKAIIIRDKTRLEQLIERFNAKAQARFYIESTGGNFEYYEEEHEVFYASLKTIKAQIGEMLKFKILYRSFLPNYIFAATDMIIVVGQDGLVANTAKYLNGLPMIAVNPDPTTYDGVLLPFDASNFENGMKALMTGAAKIKSITLAEAVMHDGQRLLAFNDFYVGANSHVSSRYTITYAGKTENQSSSGILVSTGAGATGWLSSVFNMTNNLLQFTGQEKYNVSMPRVKWGDERLYFAVREPFASHVTQTTIGFGMITKQAKLQIASKMPVNGVIFSDGIEHDFLQFNTGSTVEIGIAKEQARLVTDND